MYCTACGSEIDPQGKCPRCLQFAGAASPSVPQGDAFFPPFEDRFVLAEEISDTPEFKILHYQHRSLKATAE